MNSSATNGAEQNQSIYYVGADVKFHHIEQSLRTLLKYRENLSKAYRYQNSQMSAEDLRAAIVYCNDKLCELLGLPKETPLCEKCLEPKKKVAFAWIDLSLTETDKSFLDVVQNQFHQSFAAMGVPPNFITDDRENNG